MISDLVLGRLAIRRQSWKARGTEEGREHTLNTNVDFGRRVFELSSVVLVGLGEGICANSGQF